MLLKFKGNTSWSFQKLINEGSFQEKVNTSDGLRTNATGMDFPEHIIKYSESGF